MLDIYCTTNETRGLFNKNEVDGIIIYTSPLYVMLSLVALLIVLIESCYTVQQFENLEFLRDYIYSSLIGICVIMMYIASNSQKYIHQSWLLFIIDLITSLIIGVALVVFTLNAMTTKLTLYNSMNHQTPKTFWWALLEYIGFGLVAGVIYAILIFGIIQLVLWLMHLINLDFIVAFIIKHSVNITSFVLLLMLGIVIWIIKDGVLDYFHIRDTSKKINNETDHNTQNINHAEVKIEQQIIVDNTKLSNTQKPKELENDEQIMISDKIQNKILTYVNTTTKLNVKALYNDNHNILSKNLKEYDNKTSSLLFSVFYLRYRDQLSLESLNEYISNLQQLKSLLNDCDTVEPNDEDFEDFKLFKTELQSWINEAKEEHKKIISKCILKQ
jgi:hypothetical protein